MYPVFKTIQGKKLWGYIDKNGNVKIPYQYLWASYFSEGLGYVKLQNEQFAYIDKTNNNIFSKSYDLASPFQHNLARIKKKNGFYTYINKKGEEWNSNFEEASATFNENGYAVVTLKGQNFLIDRNNNIVLKSYRELSGDFRHGLAKAYIDAGAELNSDLSISGDMYDGYISRNGKEIFFIVK